MRIHSITACIVAVAGSVAASGAAFAQAQRKPNILWITIEDTSPQFIGCYGNENAQTPNIDELARHGVRFTGAFSTNTVCSPSRTALITGVNTFETGTGHHRSDIPIPEFMHGFPYYMQQAGYYTSNNHKTDYNVQGEKAFTDNAWNESSKEAGWWDREPGQPFFAVFNFADSHQSRTMTSPYGQYRKNVLDKLPVSVRIGENDFEMPPFYRDTPEMREQFARVYNSIALTDQKIGKLLDRLEEDGLADSTIIFFFGDHGEGIPRGKTNGIGLGYRVPFIIWIPPMYREVSPWEAGTVTSEPVNFLDLAPTLISLAGGREPEYMTGRVLLGSEREKPGDYLELSTDRSDNGIDMVRSITDGRYIYSRNYLPFMPEARYINYMEQGEIKHLMRRDLDDGRLNPLQKSLFQPRPVEFLFDMEQDPWETDNLADDPAFRRLLEEMRRQLDRRVMRSRDVMFLPEYELARISEGNTTPYEYRLDEAAYPLKEIYEAASLSGFRGENTARRQAGLLTSKNPIVRYWAITGLRSQTAETISEYSQQVHEAVQDPYPPVSITAAAIAWDVFGDAAAAEQLKKYGAGADPDLALMSVNFLLYVANKQPFVSFIRDLSNRKKLDINVKWACEDFLEATGLAGDKGAQQPSIILINVDDLGWKDQGYAGSEFYETPFIDQLAREGMVFTNAYACAANCAPSRAGMLSGRYTTAHGIYTVGTSARGDKKDRRLIPVKNRTVLADSFYTLAEMLRDNGYHTGIFGKWHLGDDARTQGFDVNVGGGHQGSPGKNGYVSPYNIDFIEDGPPGEYLADRLTSEAIRFMEKNNKEPFFLYLPFYSVHTPIMGKKDLIKRFADKKGQDGQRRADYAAMIYAVDLNIGRLFSKLAELDLEDNTLVIFTSDNGGVDHISDQEPLRAGKGSFYEGGIRVPLIIKWSGTINPGSSDYPVTNMDFYPTLRAIVNSSGKPVTLDGMDLSPLLLSAKILPVRDLFWHFPIYLQANGPKPNKELRDPLFRTRPGSVVRSGKWKLHEYFEDGGLELYNLENDPGEQNNLAKGMPDKIKELRDLLMEWRTDHHAPVPTMLNPAFDPQ